MRRMFLIFAISLIGISSCKKRKSATMEIIRGCEGTYLRLNDLDYGICNDEILDDHESGTFIEVSYIKDNECKNSRVYCGKVHDHQTAEGGYKILKIK